MKVSGGRLAFAFAAAICLAGPAAAQTVEEGVAAWQAGRDDDAVRIWMPLAEAGNVEAQFQIGNAYRLGRGVPRNLRQAEVWYSRAAASGHQESQTLAGLLILHDGRATEALPLIERAVERGDPRAQYVLGVALFHGDFMTQNRARGYALMAQAAAQGFAAAAERLREMETQLTADERIRAAAMMPRQESAEAPPPAPPPPPPPVQAEAPPQTAETAPPASSSVTPPAPPARESAVRPEPDGRWLVQFAALGSRDAARGEWERLRRAVPVLAGLDPIYETAGAFIRLRTGPFATRAQAERVCAAAKSAGKACFVAAR